MLHSINFSAFVNTLYALYYLLSFIFFTVCSCFMNSFGLWPLSLHLSIISSFLKGTNTSSPLCSALICLSISFKSYTIIIILHNQNGPLSLGLPFLHLSVSLSCVETHLFCFGSDSGDTKDPVVKWLDEANHSPNSLYAQRISCSRFCLFISFGFYSCFSLVPGVVTYTNKHSME